MKKILLIVFIFILLNPLLFYDGKPTLFFWLALILSAVALGRSSKSKADRKFNKERKFYKERIEFPTPILEAKEEIEKEEEESQAEVKRKKEEAEAKRKQEEAEAKRNQMEAEALAEAKLKLEKATELKRKKEEIKARLSEAKEKKEKEEAEEKRKKEEAEIRAAEIKRKKEEAEAKLDETRIKIEKIADFEDLYFNQASDEWMELVKYSIDESDAPIIMELDSTTTSDDLIFTKKRKDQKRYRSKILKQLSLKSEARSAYINETELEVEPMCIKHNKFPWLIASLDGVSSDFESIVEFDCSASSYWKAKNNKISDINYAKLQHLMMVSGSDVIDYWSYWPGKKGILQKVERNDTYIESLFKSQLEFADNLI
jgi:putative phage-type endonuclease